MEYICNSENKGIISVGLNDSASTSIRGRKICTSDIYVLETLYIGKLYLIPI